MEVISKKEAKARGLNYYFTGKPCKNGHLDIRRITGHCVSCGRAHTATWASRNKDKRPAQSRRYRLKHQDCLYEKNRQYRKANKEKIYRLGRDWRLANIDHCRATDRKRRAKNRDEILVYQKEWHRKNPAKDREYKLRWLEKNPGADLAWRANRRARYKNAIGTHTKEEIQDIIRMQRGKCAICRIKMITPCMDHIVPLAAGGTNFRGNLQAVCRSCNSRKHAKDPIEFARSLGNLL
jgi:5-methylcytosine-specific restriction endonuclease McrA